MAKEVYSIIKKYPVVETYGMVDQLRRASLSIPLNIAEGYAKRESQADFRRFLVMALGSSNEMLVLIDFSKDVGYIKAETHAKMYTEYEGICKMLSGFIKRIESEQKTSYSMQ